MNRSYGIYPIGEHYLFDVLQRKLEKRSEKGWMADYIGVFFIKYKKCEPKKRKVQIVYDPENMEYWRNDSEYTQGLEEYVESAGWVKACDYFKQKIYYNDDPDAVPIDTDERVRFENIKESMTAFSLVTFIAIIGLLFFGLMFGDGIHWENFPLHGVPAIFIILVIPVTLVVDYIMYALWLRKCDKNLEAGLGLASTEPSHIVSIIVLILLLACAAGMFIYSLNTGAQAFEIKGIIKCFGFLIVLGLARKAGASLKERKTSSWITFGVMLVLLYVLDQLIDMI